MMGYTYKALYMYKGKEYQLRNSVWTMADFEEDFKRHTKEGSICTYVGFNLIDDKEAPSSEPS